MDKDEKIVALRNRLKTYPGFPEKWILFRDIFSLFEKPSMLPDIIELFLEKIDGVKVDVFVGIESKGFIFSAVLAEKLGCSFVPVRKKGKLPGKYVWGTGTRQGAILVHKFKYIMLIIRNGCISLWHLIICPDL